MGSADKYDISWNNFESRLSRSFADIRDREQFLDVALAADAADGSVEVLRAHRVVLSACSPVLRNLLAKQSALASHSPVMPVMLYLRGFSAKDLSHVLEFIYRGNVNLHQYELDDFLAVARSLQIPLDEEDDNPKGLPKPNKRSSPTPSSARGGGKQQIKRPKKTMSPKSGTNGNHEMSAPEIVKMEESNEPEVLGVDEEEQDEETAHGSELE